MRSIVASRKCSTKHLINFVDIVLKPLLLHKPKTSIL